MASPSSSQNGIEVVQSPADSAFARRIVKDKLKNLTHKDFESFFAAALHEFIRLTQEILAQHNKIKSYLLLEAVFVRPNPKALAVGVGASDADNSVDEPSE